MPVQITATHTIMSKTRIPKSSREGEADQLASKKVAAAHARTNATMSKAFSARSKPLRRPQS